MPRRKGKITKRKIAPDGKFGDVLVSRLVNAVMRQGKKSVAEKVCYQAFDIIADKTKEDPLKIFTKALNNIKPVLEVIPRCNTGCARWWWSYLHQCEQ